MKQEVLDIKGNKTDREAEFSDAVFGIVPNEHAMYLDVKRYQANQRSGTHKSKTRGEIHGSTKKLGKQKGGGVARKG